MAGTPTSPSGDSKLPALVAFGLVALGIVIAVAMGGLSRGSAGGGVVALLGVIPACVGMFKGIQQQTQTTLALSIGALICSLGVGGILLILRIVDAIRH